MSSGLPHSAVRPFPVRSIDVDTETELLTLLTKGKLKSTLPIQAARRRSDVEPLLLHHMARQVVCRPWHSWCLSTFRSPASFPRAVALPRVPPPRRAARPRPAGVLPLRRGLPPNRPLLRLVAAVNSFALLTAGYS